MTFIYIILAQEKCHLFVCWGLEGDIKVTERERVHNLKFSIELELSKSPWLCSQTSSVVYQYPPSLNNTYVTVMFVSLEIRRNVMGKYQRIISRSKACGFHLHVFQWEGLKEFSVIELLIIMAWIKYMVQLYYLYMHVTSTRFLLHYWAFLW